MKTLSDKTEIIKCTDHNLYGEWINIEDVKEFIKELKEEINNPTFENINEKIDKLAGPKLT